ncbi:bifunctional glutamate--cysteine ligase GshA/glutathione synthetase GshB [Aerococcaceae bacterium DSM 111021]|nr:bifunctional glutamate--cysteine ligase GshA/glutathione synthetase GshB [Aerococcaceae bacterium DSM 111021]
MITQERFFKLVQVPGLWRSTIGLERESLRIDHDGNISNHLHSSEWGTRKQQPYIQTDFAESQLELITPPTHSITELQDWLSSFHQIVATTNEVNGDLLWPFSTPVIIPDKTEDIKIAQLEKVEEYNYRAFLAELYGKHVQLISGIHYNFQINPEVESDSFGAQTEFDDELLFNNEVYMHLTRNYFRYRWLLTYAIGASPYVAPNYATNLYGKPHSDRMRSIRQSRFGYQNKETVVMNYDSLDEFVESIEEAVNSGALSLEKELYRDVRLRGGATARELLDNGISYLEFRNIDLNPYHPHGIDNDTIALVRLFLITLLFLPDVTHDSEIDKGTEMNYATSEADALDTPIDIEEARWLIKAMREVSQQLPSIDNIPSIVDKLEASLEDPSLTLAGQIVKDAKNYDEFLDMGLSLAKEHQAVYLDKPYLLHGFDDLELSTQDVLKEAIKAGIKVRIIDADENIIELSYQGQTEYVKSANMTRLDSLISYFLMENKVATKVLLDEGGLNVPTGTSFNNIEDAKAFYASLPNKAIVVKPKNTNYGLGITIFRDKPDQDDYNDALSFAYKEDHTVLVEEYIEGTELRFYIQDNKTMAIVERRPAHVIGDGSSTISELIDEVNKNPLRGRDHKAPLTIIEKGRIETLQLKNYGYTFESIPEKDKTVFLRENSNVSTGGISIDRTDDTHKGYKSIAERASELLNANFCGVDIIIKDYTNEPTSDNYGIIEANFNPMIAIHRFPGEGTPRLLGKAMVEQLFPDVYKS